MTCKLCSMIDEKKKTKIVYEDSDIVAFLSDNPSVVGHIIIAPKKHSPIFEAVDDPITGKLFNIANKISAAVFESIGAKGTNLIVHNGIAAGQEDPHFSINIISRRDDDGIIFDWPPKQLSEEEMATIELQMKEGLKEKPQISAEQPAPKEEKKDYFS